jgi:hypothetical protein
MLFTRSTPRLQLSELSERIQRLEKEHAELLARIAAEQADLRARIEGDAALRRIAAEVTAAAHAAPTLGSALEGFAAAMRRPLKRGRAGGLARARQASQLRERWSDGRYMAHADWEQIERELSEAEYMRHAAGGFARAVSAVRAPDGTFLPR